ncbi:HNH endonuclease [Mycolicibacterium mageritense]|uniref:HNH endonuclease n=1 Tax=Mycolicibacterium mageritense TaxID=53462 RepID=UPI001E434337|nr:HNH endonuclease [Mycolicibacterium mageritense]
MFELAELSQVSADADEVALHRRMEELERAKSAAAAGQARCAALMDAKRRATDAAKGVPAARQGRGLGSEIGLARHDSPEQGRAHLAMAKLLVHDMPNTLAALECGALSEQRAAIIVREAAHLSAADRRRLDVELCGDHGTLAGMGDTRIRDEAKTISYRLDPQGAADRADQAPMDRTVTLRPAPNAMVHLTAYLPAAEGIQTFDALQQSADTCTDGRNRGQAMADTLVARVTGRDPMRTPAPVAVSLILSDRTLLGADSAPAVLQGHGPMPASVAREMVRRAALDDESRATLRRLYARPQTGVLVAMESRSRRFPKGLARFIATRDQTCRTPYCNAPIRHSDHVRSHHRGGPTAAGNGQGMCAHCNQVKETPGWQTFAGTDHNGQHTTIVVTPTGATYRSTAPPAPGHPRVLTRDVHVVVNRRAA